jgi:hypothetical protein
MAVTARLRREERSRCMGDSEYIPPRPDAQRRTIDAVYGRSGAGQLESLAV